MQLIDNLMDLDNSVVGASLGGESADVVYASPIGKPTNTSRDTPSPEESLDMPRTSIFQSNNDGNEDQSSTCFPALILEFSLKNTLITWIYHHNI